MDAHELLLLGVGFVIGVGLVIGLVVWLRRDAAPLLAVTKNLKEFTTDPDVLLQARRAVIEKLLAGQKR